MSVEVLYTADPAMGFAKDDITPECPSESNNTSGPLSRPELIFFTSEPQLEGNQQRLILHLSD